jgi:hypothetical protein
MALNKIIVLIKPARAFWASTLLVLASALAVPGRAADIPQEYVEAVHRAEISGTALFEAEAKGAPPEDTAVVAAKSRVNGICDFQYVPVQVTENGEAALYLLAQSREPSDVIIGRHFKVTATTVEVSSKSCLNLHLAPNAVAMYVTHLLAPTPSEFHVYLTLKHKIGLYVGTSAGNWLVKNGVITFLEARKPAPLK